MSWTIGGIAVVILIVLWFWHHQRKLEKRARMMQEAIRNRDFTFRLPTRHLFSGERALQETLNQLGEHVREQVNLGEVESWEKLTRVLTHEIMNATAPISSITQSFLSRPDVKGTPLEDGIRAIRDTSSGLTSFVESYRKFMQLQKSEPQDISLREVVVNVQSLYTSLVWQLDNSIDRTVCADANLLRQVLTNLVKNAKEAGATTIDLRWTADGMAVSNDGAPIPAEVRKEIFVPFFTTKQSGSGIGLALSRQMMVMQGGDLTLSEPPITGFPVTFLLQLMREPSLESLS